MQQYFWLVVVFGFLFFVADLLKNLHIARELLPSVRKAQLLSSDEKVNVFVRAHIETSHLTKELVSGLFWYILTLGSIHYQAPFSGAVFGCIGLLLLHGSMIWVSVRHSKIVRIYTGQLTQQERDKFRKAVTASKR